MGTAYTAAAGVVVPPPDATELGAGNISGMTIVPGLYKWSTGVFTDGSGFTLSGGPNAVWIFQIAGDLTLANNAKMILAGGAQANNIFWQVGGPTGATLGTTTSFFGTILSAKQVIMNTGATFVGRALAQTQVTLQSTAGTSPGPLVGGIPPLAGPTVTGTFPVNGALAAPINAALTATFSEGMDPATIISPALTFTLKNNTLGGAAVLGTVTYVGVTATFTPSANLIPGDNYTATITAAAKDPAGVALAPAPYVWTFIAGAGADITPPTVSSTVPADHAIGVPVGNALSATFSKAMNPATITTATFTLKQGVTPVAGSVIYAGVTATFTPTANLASNLPYTATITPGVTDLAGNAMLFPFSWGFTTGVAPDITPPTVSSTVPVSGALSVPVGNALSVTFSKPMKPISINATTFSLAQGSTSVPGTVNYSGVTATFTPSGNLLPRQLYTATVTTGVVDLAGNAMVAKYVWTFNSGATPDTTPPTVISTVPATGATNISVGNALSVTFSKPMNPLTINTAAFSLKQGGTPVAGTVVYAGVTATFTPASSLAPNVLYTAAVTTAVTDLAGNAMANPYVWSFTTGATPDITPPAVISTVPANGALLVTTSANLVANFSKAMNPLTITTATFLLRQGTTAVVGTVVYTGTAATFRPVNALVPNSQYTASITNAAADLAGNTLPASYVWTFTTGGGAGQSSVCLPNFAVLSGSAIVNTGATAVTGDIGVTPGTAVSGFPPGVLSGIVHADDAVATQALADASTAYQAAVALSTGSVVVAGDIGGQTFTAGLYQSLSSLAISSGDLTLDAKGDPNAVFIFQMASTLTTAAGRSVILTGAAQASNVYWQVGTSAALGATSAFNGSILANQSITLGSGATVVGRLVALTGTVTLQSNTITSPSPAIGLGGIINAATEAGPVAPGSMASVFGSNFGSATTVASSYPLPVALGGVNFQIGVQPARLFMTSCGQVNLQIPWESAGQTQLPVTVTAGGLASAQQPVTIAPFAPGIFSLNQVGTGQGAVEIAPTAQLAAPAPLGRPIARGEYVAIFCTGLGPVSNQPADGAPGLSSPLSQTLTLPVVTIGNVQAQVTYSGLAPGLAGLYQVNAVVPAGAVSGNAVPLVITIGGIPSNAVTIAVQ
jgi:uncharacterized protein (TIGR03437 family)